jgi:hypothetical protein
LPLPHHNVSAGTTLNLRLAFVLLLAGCGHDDALPPQTSPLANRNGTPADLELRLRLLSRDSGVPDATGSVGAPHDRFAARTYIAGALTNTAPNLVNQIRKPQRIEPGTAMPNLGVSDGQAGHNATYLDPLR